MRKCREAKQGGKTRKGGKAGSQGRQDREATVCIGLGVQLTKNLIKMVKPLR
jgi:hypothetical protein